MFGKQDEAIDTFTEAKKRELSTITIIEQLAKAYADLFKHAEAIECMKDVVKDLDMVGNPSEKDTDRLRGDIQDLIGWSSRIGELDMAIKWCEEALKYGKRKSLVYRFKIKALTENNRIKEITDLLLE